MNRLSLVLAFGVRDVFTCRRSIRRVLRSRRAACQMRRRGTATPESVARCDSMGARSVCPARQREPNHRVLREPNYRVLRNGGGGHRMPFR